MFTACPHCNFLLAHAPGQPRPSACPRCGQALAAAPAAASAPAGAAGSGASDTPALVTLLAPLDETPQAPPAAETDAAAPAPATAAGPPAAMEPPSPAQATAAEPAVAHATTAASPQRAIAMPVAGSPRPGLAPWQWALVAGLAVLLGVQVLLADRARLAADPQWRPLLERACGLLGCALPPWHQPSAFTMIERSVRPARVDGALQVEATFRNDAPWAQAWPHLQLSLADADGRTTGSGVFAPAQYLAAAPEGLLAPGQSAHVTFLVQEPGPGTIAFSFQFR